MRRLFIIRKDLHLSGGKLAAMVGHCCEAYWTNLLKKLFNDAVKDGLVDTSTDDFVGFPINIDYNIWHQYVNGIFTKTICEAKNKNQLMKIIELINEHNNQVTREDEMLIKDIDYGFINDCCLTELTPENEDGTTTIGIWFKPLPDDIAHKFSKKYKLYRD
jgi:peptidyl-tRNA hydrolase